MYLLFDTETTGLLHDNPHIVQLAAVLVDGEYRTVGEMNVMIKPEGWAIPGEVALVHGITTERAARYGVPIASALSLFESLERHAYILIAHNIQFDWAVLNLEYSRLGRQQRWSTVRQFCTMREAKPLVKIPSLYYHGDKLPSLAEAYRSFFGEDFAGAHNARNDLQACLRIFQHLQQMINRSPFSLQDGEQFVRWFLNRLETEEL